MMVGCTVIWYSPLASLRNSAPQPYFSTRTTPRVLPTLKPSAARLSIAFCENRSLTFHIGIQRKEVGHFCKAQPLATDRWRAPKWRPDSGSGGCRVHLGVNRG